MLCDLGYRNVHVLHADGTLGWSEHAPFDAIVVTAGGPEVPESLKAQLEVGGRLVIPVGIDRGVQELLRVIRVSGGLLRYGGPCGRPLRPAGGRGRLGVEWGPFRRPTRKRLTMSFANADRATALTCLNTALRSLGLSWVAQGIRTCGGDNVQTSVRRGRRFEIVSQGGHACDRPGEGDWRGADGVLRLARLSVAGLRRRIPYSPIRARSTPHNVPRRPKHPETISVKAREAACGSNPCTRLPIRRGKASLRRPARASAMRS